MSFTNSCELRYTWCQSLSIINDKPIGFLPLHPDRPTHSCFSRLYCLPEAGFSFFTYFGLHYRFGLPDFYFSLDLLPGLGLLCISQLSSSLFPFDLFLFSSEFFFFYYYFFFLSEFFFSKVFLFLASARMALVVLFTTRSMALAELFVWTNHLPAALLAQVRTILMAILRQLFSYSFYSSNSGSRKQAYSNSFCFICQYLFIILALSYLEARLVWTPLKILIQQACFLFKRFTRQFCSPSSYCRASSSSCYRLRSAISLRTSNQNLGVFDVQLRMSCPQKSLARGSAPFFSNTMQKSSCPHAAAQKSRVCWPKLSQLFSKSAGMFILLIRAI